MDDHHVAGIHAALTALSVDVGRLSERLIALDAKLSYHTQTEHQEFKDALAIVSEIKDDLASLQGLMNQGKGAWLALAKLAGILAAIIAVATSVWHILSGGR